MQKPKTIDEYILNFPNEIQLKLQKLRTEIGKAAPEAEEVISYGLPAFRFNGILVYFGAGKKHIGFYPTPSGIAAFEKEFERINLKYSKGSVQFPYEQGLPLDLIRRIVLFRLNENRNK